MKNTHCMKVTFCRSGSNDRVEIPDFVLFRDFRGVLIT
jgi:hypothetical protein